MEHPFKVGDWVKCIDNQGVAEYLVLHEHYKVELVEEDDYSGNIRLHFCAMDNGIGWFAESFELDEFYMAVLNA